MSAAKGQSLLSQPASSRRNAFGASRHCRDSRNIVSQQRSTSLQRGDLPNGGILQAVVELIFRFPPIWELAKQGDEEVQALRSLVSSWDAQLDRVEDKTLDYPDYYTRPFHAYNEGNLCWEAAFQVPSAAKLVHAPVMDPESKEMDPRGDQRMRESYSAKLISFMEQLGNRKPKQIVDIGCASGLSTMELAKSFPDADVLGLDLSPHFLAVAQVLQEQRCQLPQDNPEKISFRHRMAEDTQLLDNSVDLLSACLIFHEIPSAGIKQILKEAFRILQPGGILGIMEMNPSSRRFQRILSNPMAYVPFKATEPWLVEYITTDVQELLRMIGFQSILCEPCTPGHFALAALKPGK